MRCRRRRGGCRDCPSRFKERSRSADSKIQQSASTSEGFPPASCCERLLPKSSATADLECPKRKAAAASPSASTGDQGDQAFAARRSAPARPRIKSPITQPEMPERIHATDPLGQRFRSGRAAADPIAPRRRRRIETAGRGGRPRARARAGKRTKRVNAHDAKASILHAAGACPPPSARPLWSS